MTEDPGVRGFKEGQFVLIDGNYSTPLYRLEESWSVSGDNDSFYIRYISDADTVLEIYSDKSEFHEFVLPLVDEITRYQIPVAKKDSVSAFRIRNRDTSARSTDFQLIGSGVEERISGLLVTNIDGYPETVIRYGVEIAGDDTYLFDKLTYNTISNFTQIRISVKYEYNGDGEDKIGLKIFGRNQERIFGLIPRKGGGSVYFYERDLGFIPDGLEISDRNSSFSLVDLGISAVSTLVPVNYSPLSADIGIMLNYDHSAWRRSDWELFSWNLFPDILVIDFRDLALQSAYLKRLAFFTEKKGFTGKLLSNEILSKLHGWNAHDYRADDLALFFTEAELEGFILNPEEIELKEILLANNIITEAENGYVPVSGGILSYSIESSPRLRRLFIFHEGYHGIFFSNHEYAELVKEIWEELDEVEKQFWYNFLLWKRYETDNPYLVINEFQSYLMQQPIENVEEYYKEYIIPQYLEAKPEKTEIMDNFLTSYPDHFLENAAEIKEIIFRLNSIRPGELRCLLVNN